MQFQDYARSAWTRFPLIILVAAAVVLFGLRGHSTSVRYESEVQVLFSAGEGVTSLDPVGYGTTQLQSMAAIVGSPEVLEPVIDRLGLDTSVSALAPTVSASLAKDTFVLTVSAEASTSDDAEALAGAVTDSLILNGQERAIHGALDASPLTPQTTSSVEGSSLSARGLVKDLIVGLVLGLGLSVLIDLVDPRMRSRNEFAQLSSVPVLSEVTRGSQASYTSMASRLALRAPDPGRRTVVVLPAGSSDVSEEAASRLSRELAQMSSSTVLVSRSPGQVDDTVVVRDFDECFPDNRVVALQEELAALGRSHDSVVISVPHLEKSSAALLLASLADSCVLVVDERRDTRAAVARTITAVREAGSASLTALLVAPRRLVKSPF